MITNRSIIDIRENTINECFYCTKNSKDCKICLWKNKL